MSYSSEVLADSPLGYWRLGDSSGTTMADSSGSSHNGTYSGTYSLAAAGLLSGDADTCVDFTSAKGTVTGASWMNASSFSVEAVIKPDTISASYNFIVSRDLNGTVGPWWLALKNGKVSFFLFAGSGTEFIGTATLAANTTYHIVCTYDGANMRIYINGTQDASTAKTGTPTSNTQDLVIGNWNASSLPFDGKIDEVALYGTALSSGRVTAHAAQVSPLTGTASLSLSATGGAAAPGAGSASLSLSASGFAGAPSAASGTAALSVSASGAAKAVGAGSASLALTASASATATASGTAHIEFGSTGTAVELHTTDTSNALAGLSLVGIAQVSFNPPVATPPVVTVSTVRVDKAVALPNPVLVKGRPT